MAADSIVDDLITHLTRVTRLDEREARRVIDEVLSYFDESPQAYVARRHRELQRLGLGNAAIYRQLSEELGERRFAAPALSERQIRRLIYG